MGEVVDISKARKNTEEEKGEKGVKEEESFEQIMERNRKNEERLKKERENANKSVLRSYRIKN